MKTRGVTLLEIVVVVALIAIVIAIVLPMLAISREQARRVQCANTLSAIGKGMVLYADQGGNGGVFPFILRPNPDPSTDASPESQMSLTLMYKSFINDARVFSCPSNPVPKAKLESLVPSSVPGWQEHAFRQRAQAPSRIQHPLVTRPVIGKQTAK